MLVHLGRWLILQIGYFCLVLLPDIDTAAPQHKTKRYRDVSDTNKVEICLNLRWEAYGSRHTGVASVIKGKTGGVISELAKKNKSINKTLDLILKKGIVQKSSKTYWNAAGFELRTLG